MRIFYTDGSCSPNPGPGGWSVVEDNVLTKWAPGWKAKGWKKKSGPIKNLDLVQKALKLYESSEAKLIWVRAHVGTDGNELADEWANKARLEKINL